MLKQFAILLMLLVSTGKLLAQMESTAFSAPGRGGVATTFTTDYQTIGINPANLGFHKSFRDPKLTIGFLEMNTTFFSEAMSRKELFDAMFKSTDVQFTAEQKQLAANKLANTAISLNADVMLIGIGLQLPNNQGVAFSIRDRIQLYTQINENAAEIAFMGASAGYFPKLLLSDGSVISNPRHPSNEGMTELSQETLDQVVNGLFLSDDNASNYSDILDGSRISSSWFREINLSYGKQLVETYDFSLYAGLGVRYIQGMMLIELAAQNGELVSSNISMSSDFGLSFGDSLEVTNPTFEPSNQVSTFNMLATPNPVGKGYGLDFGITMRIKRNLYVGLAITNLGNIKWDGNVYEVTDGKLVQFAGAGFDNYNLLASSQGAFQFAGDKSPFSWEGSSSITQELPSTIRLGGSYEIYRTFHVGIDVVVPRNRIAGNLEKPLYAVGGDFRVSKIIKVSTGFNFGGNNDSKVNLPAGITYMARKGFYETGIATRDITTFFGDFGGSTVPFAAGFLRFKL
ncbi:DUF5723 family protein [Flammeovirgaceae bacterium SG7u.111]|nr:DUF5723 family protein [Flammeovirgaceae bacterium SG7u.111]